MALKELGKRLEARIEQERAAAKKSRREVAIREDKVVRDYDFKKGQVYDRRSGKSATLKEVLRKGNIDLIRPNRFDVDKIDDELFP